MLESILKLILKPYVKYKLNDIITAEIKSMTDDSYESPYFKDERWNKTAWDIHRKVKSAYDEVIQNVYKIIDDMNLTDEEKEKAYNLLTFEPYCNEEGKLCINIKTLNN